MAKVNKAEQQSHQPQWAEWQVQRAMQGQPCIMHMREQSAASLSLLI